MRQSILGAWRLLTWRDRGPDGSVGDRYGPGLFGLVLFDASGFMSAQIMLPPGETGAAGGYIAYCGRFQVDEESRLLTTRVEASVSPPMRGSDQVRRFDLEDDRLVLRPPRGPGGSESELVWQRL